MNRIPGNELKVSLVKEIMYNSLAQAIIKIVQTPHVTLKLVLTICVALTSSTASYLIIKSVLSYFAYEVTSVTRIISETPAPFPKVTICNSNAFTTEYAVEFLNEINSEISPQVNLFGMGHLKNANYSVKLALANKLFPLAQYKMNADSFSDQNRTRLSHSIDDILLSCIYYGKPCGVKDFNWEFDSRLGNCYAFNSRSKFANKSTPLLQSRVGGSDSGLKLTFYANFHENLTLYNSFTGDSGLKIRVENNTFMRDSSESVTQIAPGLKTDVIVERFFNDMLPKPYSNCDIDKNRENQFDDSDVYNLIKNSSYVYDEQLCFKQCRQKFYLDNCNCTSARTLSLFDAPKCVLKDQLKCKDRISDVIFLNQNQTALDQCYAKCPLECDQAFLKTFTSHTKLVGDSFADYIRENRNLSRDFLTKEINSETARESIVKLYVFYDSLFYTMSVESPKTDLVMLMAYVGGILGLFLGVSVLSLCEIVELLIEIYFIYNLKVKPTSDLKSTLNYNKF